MKPSSTDGLVFRDGEGGVWIPIIPGERWKIKRAFRFPDGSLRYCRPKHSAEKESIGSTPVSEEMLAAMSRDLVAVGERLEQASSPDWLAVARAAALLDGLRFNLVSIPGGCHASH